MRLLSLLSILVVVGAASPAYAELSPPWLFVPVLSAAPDPKVDKVLRAFESAAGERAIRNGSAAQQFERLRSKEPVDSSGEDIARVEAETEAAVKQLGSGRLRPGHSALEQVERVLEGERGDAYRRSLERVQTLFDACSLSAMLLSRAKRRDDAAAQMAHCVRAYPGSAPEGEPEIQPLFDVAAARIAHGTLHVDGDGGCVVRANGIELGPSPLQIALPVGDYRIQLECSPDEPGRIHFVRVGEGENRITADPLDASVHTRRGLWLWQRESTDSDAQAIARLLGAQVVLLVGEGERVRVRTDGRDIAVLAPGDDVRPILPLLEAPEGDTPAAPATVQAAAQAPGEVAVEASADAPSRSPIEYVAGISLLVVGTASLTLGWVFYAQRYSLRTRFYGEDVPYDSRDRFTSLGAAAIGVSAFGAAMLTAAEPLLVSDDGIPAAAWVLAAGGLGLVAAGIGFGLAHHCEPQVAAQHVPGLSCGFVNDAVFGPFLAMHGLPLLALPAMYGLRQWISGGTTVVLGFDGTGGHMGVRGTF